MDELRRESGFCRASDLGPPQRTRCPSWREQTVPFRDVALVTDHAGARRLLARPCPGQRKSRSGGAGTCPCLGVAFFSVIFVVVIVGSVETGRGWGAGQSCRGPHRRSDSLAFQGLPSAGFPLCLHPSPFVLGPTAPSPPWAGRPSSPVPCQALWAECSSPAAAASAFGPAGPPSLMCLKGPRCLLPAPQKASRMPTGWKGNGLWFDNVL